MGAWDFVRPSLEGLAGGRRFAVLARPRSSSPAEGSTARHAQNQARLVSMAFDLRGGKDGKDATRPAGAKAGVS
jgi:2-oxoglutarate dehydrogenase complex dehydrogenase (E1) component-like enzyme